MKLSIRVSRRRRRLNAGLVNQSTSRKNSIQYRQRNDCEHTQ